MGKLLKGIGNSKEVKKFYDNWSSSYDLSLQKWGYKAPYHSLKILKKKLKKKPKYLLDLACGTGLFAEEFKKNYPKSICDGSDISKDILEIAKTKKVYNKLYKINFEKKILIKHKYHVVSIIGAMTYCSNHKLFFKLVNNYLYRNGLLVFTQRCDLWEKFDFDQLLNNLSIFKKLYVSRPMNYLPKNREFGTKIKIRISVLQRLN